MAGAPSPGEPASIGGKRTVRWGRVAPDRRSRIAYLPRRPRVAEWLRRPQQAKALESSRHEEEGWWLSRPAGETKGNPEARSRSNHQTRAVRGAGYEGAARDQTSQTRYSRAQLQESALFHGLLAGGFESRIKAPLAGGGARHETSPQGWPGRATGPEGASAGANGHRLAPNHARGQPRLQRAIISRAGTLGVPGPRRFHRCEGWAPAKFGSRRVSV